MPLVDEFRNVRRAGTPIFCVLTPDFRAAAKAMSEVTVTDKTEPIVYWDIATGHKPMFVQSSEKISTL